MKVAYVDTSYLVAIAFGEARARSASAALRSYDVLLSSNLLEAELRAALHRERVAASPRYLDAISWILPDRPLRPEIERVLGYGYLRGADLWHLACALFLAADPPEMSFLTLDDRQATVASKLGFLL